MGWGNWGFARPQGAGMGCESFHRHAKRGEDEVKQNHAGRRRKPHPSTLSRPITIPNQNHIPNLFSLVLNGDLCGVINAE